jgi:asparaginyl-tRNA synthetase
MAEDERLVGKLTVASDVINAAVDFFHDEGFIQLLPVMLGKSTDPLGPDPGSSVIKTAEIEYLGAKLRLMNSMILHKQVAVRKLGKKIWILSPNIRLEKGERKTTKKHLFEFTQADFEIPNAKKEDVMALVERFYKKLNKRMRKSEAFTALGIEPFKFKTPFKVYETHKLEEKYGADWEAPASEAAKQPFWALCHKREFYDKEDVSNPGHYLNYDLVYPLGFGEALSGGERESDYKRILERMGRDKLSMDIYTAYLKEAEQGFLPSAGAGFGIERLVRFLTKEEHIGGVQLFRRVPGEDITI